MDKVKTWSEVIGIWITIIGVFIGAIFALTQYLENSKSERVKVTLKYVDRFYEDPLQSARLRIENKLYPEREKLLNLREEELKPFIIDFILKNLKNETDLVISFFEQLHACACANLCDEDTIREYFRKDAFEFYALNLPYIEVERQELRDDSYGAAILLIANSYKTGKTFSESLCKAKH